MPLSSLAFLLSLPCSIKKKNKKKFILGITYLFIGYLPDQNVRCTEEWEFIQYCIPSSWTQIAEWERKIMCEVTDWKYRLLHVLE